MPDRMSSYTPKPGDYIVTTDLPMDAIAIFLDDMRKAGARKGSPLEKAEDRTYFGWDLRDNTVYACDNLRVGSRTLFHNNVTDYYRRVHAMTSTTTRNPFQSGDRVVPNGFKARPDGDHYYYGDNPIMAGWERDKTVLHVQTISSERVRAGRETNFYSYHPAELRMATAEEIAKAHEPKVPEQLPLAKGMVIKTAEGIAMIVVNPEPDGDGDIRVTKLGGNSGTYFRPTRGYTVLGQIMEDGDFRPAEAIRSATDPSQWKRGQHVRCITDQRVYITKGHVYTLIADASTDRHGITRIHIFDNDGDESTYRVADQFEAV